jgi:predicted nucleic acid-binding protein
VKTIFVDSNVFLRIFTFDDRGQHERAARLLREAAAGRVALVTGPPVLFEVAWVLRSNYRIPPERILDALSALIAHHGLKLFDSDIAVEAIALARRSGSEFADAYIATAARAGGADEIASFNRTHFERLAAKLADL